MTTDEDLITIFRRRVNRRFSKYPIQVLENTEEQPFQVTIDISSVSDQEFFEEQFHVYCSKMFTEFEVSSEDSLLVATLIDE